MLMFLLSTLIYGWIIYLLVIDPYFDQFTFQCQCLIKLSNFIVLIVILIFVIVLLQTTAVNNQQNKQE